MALKMKKAGPPLEWKENECPRDALRSPVLYEAESMVRKQRCSFCNGRKHTEEECRRKQAAMEALRISTARDEARPHTEPLRCFGCKTPGVVRSRCPKCNLPGGVIAAVDQVEPNQFCSVVTPAAGFRPLVNVKIADSSGQAIFDTGAISSVASDTLLKVFKEKKLQPRTKQMQMVLADGLADGPPARWTSTEPS